MKIKDIKKTNEIAKGFTDLLNTPLEKIIAGENSEYYIYEAPVSSLKFNIYNGRFAAEILLAESNISKQNNYQENNENIMRIIEANSPGFNKLVNQIESDGQRELGVVTEDGIIVDGNRRATVAHKLGKDFRFIILKGEYKLKKSIEQIEGYVQLERDSKEEYTLLNKRLKLLSIYENEIGKEAEYMNINEDALQKTHDVSGNTTRAQTKETIQVMSYMRKALEFWGERNNFAKNSDNYTKIMYLIKSLIVLHKAQDKNELPKWFKSTTINEFEEAILKIIPYELPLQFSRSSLLLSKSDLKVLKYEESFEKFSKLIEEVSKYKKENMDEYSDIINKYSLEMKNNQRKERKIRLEKAAQNSSSSSQDEIILNMAVIQIKTLISSGKTPDEVIELIRQRI